MSRIYFHTEQGRAEVAGWERAHAGCLCNDLLMVALRAIDTDDTPERPSPIRRLMPADCYALRETGQRFASWLRTWANVGDGAAFVVDGEQVSAFDAALNTALVVGSDPVRLLARLHGQCEIHAWVAGPNRVWLAGIVDEGLASGLIRPDSGWESIAALLRSRDDGPVVTSYSVTDQFPNPGAAGWKPPIKSDDEDWDAWYELSEEEQWRQAFEGLQAKDPDHWLEMRPEHWVNYHFGNGWNGFQLRAHAARLANAEKGGVNLAPSIG